jgi:hypothetical protein
MSNEKLRRQITYEAARMLYARQESEYGRAKVRAARLVCRGWIHPNDLPTNREIREEIQSLARLQEAGRRFDAPHEPTDKGDDPLTDRFAVYYRLLVPLETVKQNPERHPEGDALYHSLQVFTLAREALPYDEEFQTAALLHDVGKAIDPRAHVTAALDALNGHITERTAWFIEHHSEANQLRDGTLGARARRRLEASQDFDDLTLLSDCDRAGRVNGAVVPDIEEALAMLRELAQDDFE